jgi:hypothetical protein
MTMERNPVVMTDEQYRNFMRENLEHQMRMESFARAQSENSGRVVEMLAVTVKAPMADRDVIAISAMGGLLSGYYSETTKYNLSDLPAEAYRIADAMIAAREEQK